MNGEKVAIYILKKLYEKIRQEVDKSQGEFKDVEEYIEFVLKELLKEEEVDRIYSEEEEERIKERLRKLGYIA